MQISQIKDRMDQMSQAWEHYKATNNERLKQAEQKGSVDPLTKQKLSRINDSLDAYKAKISSLEIALNRPGTNLSSHNSYKNSAQKSTFSAYLRKGADAQFRNLESKSLVMNSNSDGGFLVDKVISNSIIKLIEANSVMRQLASIEEISTHALEIIKEEGKLDAGWVAEVDSRTDTKTPKLDKQKIEVNEIYAQPKATQKLIDDSKIDIVQWLTEKIADRFADIESSAFISGDGINKPRGILNYKDEKESNQIEQLDADYKSMSADDIMILYYSLPSKYAANASFLMHRNMLQKIRSFKCPTTGHYIWAPGIVVGTPDTLLGAPVYESPHMPIASENSLTVAFADFKEAYKIVDRTNINIIRDPFTDKPFVKFYATKRVGGAVVNSRAIKLLKSADAAASK